MRRTVWVDALGPAIASLKRQITDETIEIFPGDHKMELLRNALREAGSGLELGKILAEMIRTFPSTLPSIQSLLEGLDENEERAEIQKQRMPFTIVGLLAEK